MNVTLNGSTWLRRAARLFAMTAIAGSVACSGCGEDPTNNNNDPGEGFDLTIAPTSQNFGALLVGNTSGASVFTVTNEGPGTASGFNVAVSGSATGDFTITGDDCSEASLDNGSECEITVEFTPQEQGSRSASLDVTAGDAAASAALTGTGQGPGELAISPTPHDFGTVVVGETSGTMDFTVTNTGDGETDDLTANLNGRDAMAFEITEDGCTGETLEAEATCTITAQFTPSSAGDLATTLRVVGGSDNGEANADLSGTAVQPASLNITPGSQNFGSIVEQTTSDDVTFTVENTGGADSGEIASSLGGADAGEFNLVTDNCNGSVLSAGEDCTIVINFGPSAEGDFTASLDVSATPGGSDSAALTGTGLTEGALQVTPTPHDFGTVVVGQTSGSQTFTIENTGGAETGNLTASLSGAHPNNFAIVAGTDSCTGNTLTAGATCTISATFSPSTDGLRNATLGISQAGGGSATAELSGTGETPAQLAIMPPSQNFGSVVVGSPSQPTTFTITNTGQATSGVPNVDLAGANFGSFQKMADGCTAALAGGDSCTVDVVCNPNSTGTKNATLDAAANPGGSVSSTLTCEGVTMGSINASTSTMTFGNVVNGGTSGLQTVVINNPGTTTTGTITTTIGGDFFIVNDTCTGNTLAGGANCDIAVEFAPTTVGPAAEDLVVSDGTTNRTVALSGTSLPEFTITPSTPRPYDFGGTDVDTLGNTQTFTVTNTAGTGSQTRELTAAAEGDEFNATSNGCDGSAVAAGGNCQVTVRFEPTGAPGTRDGTLTATDDFGVTKVRNLTGTALSPFDLDISPVQHDFDQVTIGTSETVTFTVTNTTGMPSGTLRTVTREWANSDDFGIVSDTCAGANLDAFGGANDSCTITIVFFPTDGSTQSAGIEVVSDTATTCDVEDDMANTMCGDGIGSGWFEGEGVGEANLVITGGDGSFGAIAATDSDTETFTVTNNGFNTTGTISVTTTGSSIFSVTSNNCVGALGTLDGGESCTFDVSVDPDTTDPLGGTNGEVVVSATPGGSATADLFATVESQLIQADATPGPADAGDPRDFNPNYPASSDFTDATIVNDPNGPEETFVVENNSGTDITSAIAVSTTGPFVIENNTCGTLDSGMTCTIDVRYAPTTVGEEQAGTLTVGSGEAGTVEWELEGDSISDANLVFENVGFTDFGNVNDGDTAGFTYTYTVRNTGDANVVVNGTPTTDIALSGDTSDFTEIVDNCTDTLLYGTVETNGTTETGGTEVAPSGCTVEYRFDPTSAGAKSLDVDVSAEQQLGTTTADSITLTGNGTAPPTADDFFIAPRSANFGQEVENSGTATQTFTVTNETASTVSGVSIVLSNTTDFNIPAANDNCSGNDLTAGQDCTVEIEFAPASVGLHTSDLTASGSGGVSDVATLFGEGQSQAALALTDGETDFGPVVEMDTETETYTITNSGTQDVTSMTFLKTGGPNVDWFTVLNNNCAAGVAGNSTCTFDVEFAPQLDLAAGADLTITPDEGNVVNVSLTGQGVLDADFELTPEDQDCGDAVPAGGETFCTVTITNPGGVPTQDFRVNMTSNIGNVSHDAGDWSLDSWTCDEGPNFNAQPGEIAGFTGLDAGAACDLTIKWAPTTVTAGGADETAEVGVTSTPSGEFSGLLSNIVDLSADSVSALTSPDGDSTQTFTAAVGSSSEQTFTFTNATGTPTSGPLHVFLDPMATSMDPEWSQESTCAGAELAPGASCDVTVTFTPATVATGKSADLHVTDDPGNTSTTNDKWETIDLEGSGT